jgi:acetyl esterase/lipase
MLLKSTGSAPQELTAGSWNLRTRVHEFGGGLYAVAGEQVVFSHGADDCLWALNLAEPSQPWRLTTPAEPGRRLFAGGLIDASRQRWLGVMESQGGDQLVAVPLAGGEPELLRQRADFCGYPALSAQADQLAWLEWSLPWMPWQRTELWWSRLGERGELLDPQCIAGGSAQPQSLFQPLWSPSGELLVVSDQSGFWTVQRWQPGGPPNWQPLGAEAAECAMPQWVEGMRTFAATERDLVVLRCLQGSWQFCVRGHQDPPEAPWQVLDLPFTDLACLSAAGDRAVCLASGPCNTQGLLEVRLSSGAWQLHLAPPLPLPPAAISRPSSIWFSGGDGEPSQAWYYSPALGQQRPSPLLVRLHSGPTGMARTGFQAGIQFWTSRGWGVVDVNYGGSSGFGRRYRERLDGQWGCLDVADCLAAVDLLIERGVVDPAWVAMEGGSAGGFSTLAALIASPLIRAGVCRYPVCDLASLARDTHRFESGYLDHLVGPLPQAEAVYAQRSPLVNRARLQRPLLFIQGLQDRVVPPQQTEMMVSALRRQGLQLELLLLEDEGHGFRSPLVQRQILEATERFLRRVLAIGALADSA